MLCARRAGQPTPFLVPPDPLLPACVILWPSWSLALSVAGIAGGCCIISILCIPLMKMMVEKRMV